jgi:flavin reductase (DIM6/NTAB) family NADH-FMN oxidoreductase RutF
MSNDDIAELFRRISCGVYVIGAADGEQRNAFTAAWLMPVSFDPLLLALSVHPAHSSYTLIDTSRAFTASVLKSDQLELARHFGARSIDGVDKLADIAWQPGISGAPILEQALAWFDCRVTDVFPAGDHKLVLGQVFDGAILNPDSAPLLYSQTGDMDGSRRLYPEDFTR